MIYIFSLNAGGSHNLDLNLGMATPGHEPKENRGYRQFQAVPYNLHPGRNLKVLNSTSTFSQKNKSSGTCI
jgi:hypothetical protein